MFRFRFQLGAALRRPAAISNRFVQSSIVNQSTSALHQRMAELIPKERERVAEIKKKYGNEILGTCTVEQAYGGMRSVKSMVTETSLLDTEEGIRFRGLTIPECQEQLPKFTPEALLWLLLTGEVPTAAQVGQLEDEIRERAQKAPEHTWKVLDGLPRDMHPMTQLTTGVLALQTESQFAAAYQSGTVRKPDFWQSTLEDALDLVARIPLVAARIYRNVYHGAQHVDAGSIDQQADMSVRFANSLGFSGDEAFYDLMRMYLVIHSDHEGGNVSAHATHLVGSALSDPYLSLAGGLCGLAGPLHGLANQEVLTWLQAVQKELGTEPTDAQVRDFLWATLDAGRVVPGYGHAVLRKTDPRYEAQRQFALKNLPEDPLFRLVSQVYEHAPDVLREHGKAANPWPNVDAHSGVLLVHYGLVEQHYYTVLFGVSRALGVLSSLVWDRALGLPLERPKSVTTGWIENHFANKK